MPWLNDREADQILLKKCLEEDRAALLQWTVDSYRTEVIRTIKGVIDRKVPGRLNRELIDSLMVLCTWTIYENYAKLPSRFRTLKSQVGKFAFAYANAYLAEYLKTHVG
jgi:hypothetical protein